MERRAVWTEADLIAFSGVPESLRLEFKESRLMSEGVEKITMSLSQEISAFANTEGGILVIGLKERREGKARIGDGLDQGIDPDRFSPEQFQQLIDGNVSPYLPGVRIHRVRLSGTRTGRIAIVIDVPRGGTAYQASDKKYYGRSEHESKPLPDHEIRMRMQRGLIASAGVSIADPRVLTAEEIHARNMKEYEISRKEDEEERIPIRKKLALPQPPDHHELSFGLAVTNTGEITIRDFLLVLRFATTFRLLSDGSPIEPESPYQFEFETVQPWRATRPAKERKVFPGQTAVFPNAVWTLEVPVQGMNLDMDKASINWVIYLDDSPPVSGDLNILDAFPAHFWERRADAGLIEPLR